MKHIVYDKNGVKFYAPNGELCATYNTRENVWLTNGITDDFAMFFTSFYY